MDIKKDSVSNQPHQKAVDSDLISITDELQAMNTENQAQVADNNANNEWTEEKLIENGKFLDKLLEKQKSIYIICLTDTCPLKKIIKLLLKS